MNTVPYAPAFTGNGLSKREYFAAQAMHALISKLPLTDTEGKYGCKITHKESAQLKNDVCNSAIWYADTLIEQLNEEVKNDK